MKQYLVVYWDADEGEWLLNTFYWRDDGRAKEHAELFASLHERHFIIEAEPAPDVSDFKYPINRVNYNG